MNLGNVRKEISLLTELAPLAVGFVKQIDAMFPSMEGSSKFQSVEAALHSAAATLEKDVGVVAAVVPKIGALIEGALTLYKSTGAFQNASAGITRVADAADKAVSAVGSIAAAVATPGVVGN